MTEWNSSQGCIFQYLQIKQCDTPHQQTEEIKII